MAAAITTAPASWTDDRAYSVRGTPDANATGLTLHEALLTLAGSVARHDDSAHIQRDGRYVAFFSACVGHERGARSMWQARPEEVAVIEDWD